MNIAGVAPIFSRFSAQFQAFIFLIKAINLIRLIAPQK